MLQAGIKLLSYEFIIISFNWRGLEDKVTAGEVAEKATHLLAEFETLEHDSGLAPAFKNSRFPLPELDAAFECS